MKVSIVGNQMTLSLDLVPEAQAPLSASGKNKILYTSGGFQLANGYRVSITVIPAKK